MNQLATGVPLRPSTPQASGWSSAIWPLALNVVITGAPSRSASAITCIAVEAGAVPDDDHRPLGRPSRLERLLERRRRRADLRAA